MAKFKIVVPKAGSANELGSDIKLYEADEKIDAKEKWQEDLMQTFVENGWAVEIKAEDIEEEGEPVRARNEQGHYIADDPSTPDVNEAYEGGKAPKKTAKKSSAKKTTKKTAKKTTKKKS
tara:strand:+ start:309 stop:668 length:360 start_codon:yes stop_codon:yes gene_type:complete